MTLINTEKSSVVINPTQNFSLLVSGGRQGVPGVAGQDITTVVTKSAAQALGGHRVVVSVDANTVDYADSANINHANIVLGITIAAATSGANIDIQRAGELIEPSWGWVPLAPVFLGHNGLLTQITPGVPDASFSLLLGYASSATSLVIKIGEPFILV